MEFLRSLLRRYFGGGGGGREAVLTSRNVGCFRFSSDIELRMFIAWHTYRRERKQSLDLVLM